MLLSYRDTCQPHTEEDISQVTEQNTSTFRWCEISYIRYTGTCELDSRLICRVVCTSFIASYGRKQNQQTSMILTRCTNYLFQGKWNSVVLVSDTAQVTNRGIGLEEVRIVAGSHGCARSAVHTLLCPGGHKRNRRNSVTKKPARKDLQKNRHHVPGLHGLSHTRERTATCIERVSAVWCI